MATTAEKSYKITSVEVFQRDVSFDEIHFPALLEKTQLQVDCSSVLFENEFTNESRNIFSFEASIVEERPTCLPVLLAACKTATVILFSDKYLYRSLASVVCAVYTTGTHRLNNFVETDAERVRRLLVGGVSVEECDLGNAAGSFDRTNTKLCPRRVCLNSLLLQRIHETVLNTSTTMTADVKRKKLRKYVVVVANALMHACSHMLQGMIRPDYFFDEDFLIKKNQAGKPVEPPAQTVYKTAYIDVGDMCEVSYYGCCRPVVAQVATTDGKHRFFDVRDLYILFPEQNAVIKADVLTTDFQESTYSSSGAGLCGEEVARLRPTAMSYKQALIAATAAIAAAPARATVTAGTTKSGNTSAVSAEAATTAAGATAVPLPSPDELVGDEVTRHSVQYYAAQQLVPSMYCGTMYNQCMVGSGEVISRESVAAVGWPGSSTRPSGSMCY